MLVKTVLLLLLKFVEALDNGLALVPPMGWMSWEYIKCQTNCSIPNKKCLNEELILGVADALARDGYQEAGYQYVIIDDCWSEKTRDDEGNLVADRTRFPRGMEYIADYVHSLGLKFGMYSNVGDITCMNFPGSKDYLRQDALTFASWGADYVKMDGCFVDTDVLDTAYVEFRDALKETGRPIVFSCSWPFYSEFIHHRDQKLEVVSKTCNLWRNYHDVLLHWENVHGVIMDYVTKRDYLAQHQGPGRWNDPDMLILGNGLLSAGQARVQVGAWCLLSAPLLLSCDMSAVTPAEARLLRNAELIAIDQDPLGLFPQTTVIRRHEAFLFVKRRHPAVANYRWTYSIGLINFAKTKVTYNFVPSRYGLNCSDGYTVMDVFREKYIKNVSSTEPVRLLARPEDAIVYTFYPLTQPMVKGSATESRGRGAVVGSNLGRAATEKLYLINP